MRRVIFAFIVLAVILGCVSGPACRFIDVPVNLTEEGSELNYSVISMYKYTDTHDGSDIVGAVVKLQNTDVRAGEFIVEETFILANGTVKSVNVTGNLSAGQTGDFRGEVGSDTLEEEAVAISGKVIPPIGGAFKSTEIRQICE